MGMTLKRLKRQIPRLLRAVGARHGVQLLFRLYMKGDFFSVGFCSALETDCVKRGCSGEWEVIYSDAASTADLRGS